jgi:WD40 repeat protein
MVALSPNGTAVACVADLRNASIIDLATGRERARCAGPTDWIYCLAFSPDGRLLAAGGTRWPARFVSGALGGCATSSPLWAQTRRRAVDGHSHTRKPLNDSLYEGLVVIRFFGHRHVRFGDSLSASREVRPGALQRNTRVHSLLPPMTVNRGA